MATLEKRSFDAPDERRTPPHAEVAFVKFGDRTFSRITYFPGFRWTTDMKPIAGTDLCMVNHFTYVVSGHVHVVMADGTEADLGPGDIGPVPAGHDAWVIGDQPFVTLDFAGAIKPE
jgi:hypothetical protein